MNPPKIFISATSGDLSSTRQIAKEALLTINCHPVEQTNFEPDARSLEKLDREKLEDCQGIIHIVGFRYGAEPNPATLPPGTGRHSYTQLEYHIGRRLQAERGDDHFRVYVFLCPEGFTFDSEPDTDSANVRELQQQHRKNIRKGPHRYEEPQDKQDIYARILALQEQVISLVQDQKSIAKEVKTTRHWGLLAATAMLLFLCGIGAWQWQTKRDTTAIVSGQTELVAQLSKVQEALGRIQQKTNAEQDPISKWPKDRLETELAQQMNFEVEDLRAVLTAGKVSLDALVAGQALLASGKQEEAGKKFDAVIAQEQTVLQRLKQAYEGKAQIAYDKVRYEEALDYFQKAAALVDKTTDPIAWASAQEHVASTLDVLARYEDSEPVRLQVLHLREQHLGINHSETAVALRNLGNLFGTINRVREAEDMYRRALKIDEVLFGPDHAEVANDLSQLAELLRSTKRLSDAELYIKRALKIDEAKEDPDNHTDVSRDCSILAYILHDTYRFEEAELMYRKALKIDEAFYKLGHPNVAVRQNDLAQLLMDCERFEEAEPLMKQALESAIATFGPDHPKVALRLSNLGELQRRTDRFQQAEQSFRQALKIDEEFFASDHPKLATRLNNLALVLRATNRLSDAEPLYQRSLAIFVAFRHSTGHEHPNFRLTVANYRSLLFAMKLPSETVEAKLRDILVP